MTHRNDTGRPRRRGGARARRAERATRARSREAAPGATASAHIADDATRGRGRVQVIACGALAREISLLLKGLGRDDIDLHCLPAEWHNAPQRIAAGVRARIRQARAAGYERIFVAYGDCGTGGALDAVLDEEGGIERLPGPHCYAFFTGVERFLEGLEEDSRSFFLTDYLVRHFDALVWKGLMLDAHPELMATYFGNYRKLVHLAQIDDPALANKGREAARRLGLAHERRLVGFGDLKAALSRL